MGRADSTHVYKAFAASICSLESKLFLGRLNPYQV